MFDEAKTRPIAEDTATILGIHERPVLIRHHTNAVYAAGDAVIKISRPGSDLARATATAALVSWLKNQHFPTVGLYPTAAEPLLVGGHVVTVWERLDPAADHPVGPDELGELLRRLHQLADPPVTLPQLDPVSRIRTCIGAADMLTDAERDLLRRRLEELSPAWHTAVFVLPPGLIQSDPQSGNALRRADGSPVLADWDTAAHGAREWDVATVAVHCRRFPKAGYFPDFTAAYGWEPSQWPHFGQICALRELRMITTNARKSPPGSRAADEVRRRINRIEDITAEWEIL